MRMIPDSPYTTNSRAEKKVFDSLRQAFPEQLDSGFTCFHSLNLTRHARKRFGEIDFLICCPYGLYVLEVKGGRVGCKDGTWQYTNRNDEVNISREGPFKQGASALHGLVSKLREKLPDASMQELVIGYGVIFPDCELTCTGAEWDPQIVFDQSARKNIQHWLESLFAYWRKKDPKRGKAQPATLKLLRRYLRPDFEAVVPLYARAGEAYQEIARLTEDQVRLVDIVAANSRILCSGGAGTGKTFLAVELARRWTGEGLNVVLVCRSPWLKNFLQSRFRIANLTVSTAEGLRSAARRQGIERFDALIVDEGQDLLDMDNLDAMEPFIEGGMSEGRWCFFYDVNNQSGFFGAHDDDALEYLVSLGAAKVPLNTNCRNTQIILEKIKSDTGADMGVRGAGAGPEVREAQAATLDEAAATLKKEIEAIIDRGGLAPGQVTILSPVDFADSAAIRLPLNMREEIVVLDEYSMQSFPPDKVSFSRIKDFKGLENEAIIVIGLPVPSGRLQSMVQHYVAMSRAKAVLSIIYSVARK